MAYSIANENALEIFVYGRQNKVLDNLWEERNLSRSFDAKLIYQDGALLCHSLPFVLASPLLARVVTPGKPCVVHLPYVSLVEAHYFLKVIYGQPFTMSASRVSRMNFILESYGIDRLEYCVRNVPEREVCPLPYLPDDIDKQIILPLNDYLVSDTYPPAEA